MTDQNPQNPPSIFGAVHNSEETPQGDNLEQNDLPKVSELDVLKKKASLLGVSYSNNIGVETLRARINEKLNSDSNDVNSLSSSSQNDPLVEAGLVDSQPSDRPLTQTELRKQLIAESLKLVRIRVTCMDPKKADLPGEFFTVANKFIGNVCKYVPFGEQTDDGYHVPYVIYKHMLKREFLHIRTKKNKHNTTVPETTWAREFAIEVLPPLTPDELNRLATAQIAAGSVG